MWDPTRIATVIILHALLTIVFGVLVLLGRIPKEHSPFGGRFNGMIDKAHQSQEVWEKSHRYNAKRRIVWAFVEIILSLIIYFAPLPAYAVIGLYMVTALMLNIPSIETARYVRSTT